MPKAIVSYFLPGTGETTREFSSEVHGDNYLDLAKEFAVTNNGNIVGEEGTPNVPVKPTRVKKVKAVRPPIDKPAV
jgi:hypothetical protein